MLHFGRRISSWFESFKQILRLATSSSPKNIVLIVCITLVAGVLPLIVTYFYKTILDILAYEQGLNTFLVKDDFLFVAVAIYSALTVFNTVLSPAQLWLQSITNRKIEFNIKMSVLSKLTDLKGLGHFENPDFYDKQQLGFQAAQQSALTATSSLTNVVRNFVTFFSFWTIVLVYSPIPAFLIVFACLPFFFFQLWIGHQRIRRDLELNPYRRRASYFEHLLSTHKAAKEIRVFGLGDYFLRKFYLVTTKIYSAEKRQARIEYGYSTFVELISSIVSVAAFIFFVQESIRGNISLGDVALYSSSISGIQIAFVAVLLGVADLNENVSFYSHYQDLLSLSQTISISKSPVSFPGVQTGIEFRNVSFRYSDQSPYVLDNVNLFIKHGEHLALVGENGAGKTTFIKLITRLYDPTHGDIFWDGVNIRDVSVRDLRARIAAVFQDFVHYDLSAWENIGIGSLENVRQMRKIKNVAKLVGLDDTLRHLPRGYETILSIWLTEGSKGVDLSGGEWQKLAIARMLMRDASLFILDEPTASLDAKAEYGLFRNLATQTKRKTTILISHRFSTVRTADRIAVLSKGRIIECGSHQELFSQKGVYSRLYRLQTKLFRA